MVVTDIKRTKRGRISVYLDGEFAFTLHQEVYALSSLEKGAQVQPQELEEYLERSREKETRERALNLLSYRDRTAKQLYDRLREKADDHCAAQTVERMQELGLVNDAEYARRLSRDLQHLKHFGPARIRQELLRKGVDRETADAALQELLEETDPQEELKALVVRRFLAYLENEKDRNRLIQRLLRMGYPLEDIRCVLRECSEQLKLEEQNEI